MYVLVISVYGRHTDKQPYTYPHHKNKRQVTPLGAADDLAGGQAGGDESEGEGDEVLAGYGDRGAMMVTIDCQLCVCRYNIL